MTTIGLTAEQIRKLTHQAKHYEPQAILDILQEEYAEYLYELSDASPFVIFNKELIEEFTDAYIMTYKTAIILGYTTIQSFVKSKDDWIATGDSTQKKFSKVIMDVSKVRRAKWSTESIRQLEKDLWQCANYICYIINFFDDAMMAEMHTVINTKLDRQEERIKNNA